MPKYIYANISAPYSSRGVSFYFQQYVLRASRARAEAIKSDIDRLWQTEVDYGVGVAVILPTGADLLPGARREYICTHLPKYMLSSSNSSDQSILTNTT